jgi:hypothetical protein
MRICTIQPPSPFWCFGGGGYLKKDVICKKKGKIISWFAAYRQRAYQQREANVAKYCQPATKVEGGERMLEWEGMPAEQHRANDDGEPKPNTWAKCQDVNTGKSLYEISATVMKSATT